MIKKALDEKYSYQIDEYYKENAELEYQLTHRNCVDCSNHSSKLRMRNLDLEKENAELKTRNQELLQSCEGATMMYKDLQKAKEIIKEMLSILPEENIEGIYEISEGAEQFLKETK